jgi:hypothetical protein
MEYHPTAHSTTAWDELTVDVTILIILIMTLGARAKLLLLLGDVLCIDDMYFFCLFCFSHRLQTLLNS